MLSPQELKNIETVLKSCKNVQQMFEVLEKNFDLENCEPGAIAKPAFITGILKGIQMLNPKKR